MTTTEAPRPERAVGLDTDAGVAHIEAWGARYRHLTIEVGDVRISILDLAGKPSVHISGDRPMDLYITGDVTTPRATRTGVEYVEVTPR